MGLSYEPCTLSLTFPPRYSIAQSILPLDVWKELQQKGIGRHDFLCTIILTLLIRNCFYWFLFAAYQARMQGRLNVASDISAKGENKSASPNGPGHRS